MPTELSPKGSQMLDDLPPMLQDDPRIQGVVDTGARELQRIEDFLATVRTKMRPQNADDDYRLLGLWESTLGLGVEPAGQSLSQRRSKVMAAVRRRFAGAGEGWVEMMNEVVGGATWEYQEHVPHDYWLLIDLPTDTETFVAQQVANLLALITPAHLKIELRYGLGFVVGIDRLGDAI